jgi:hypothetical protein
MSRPRQAITVGLLLAILAGFLVLRGSSCSRESLDGTWTATSFQLGSSPAMPAGADNVWTVTLSPDGRYLEKFETNFMDRMSYEAIGTYVCDDATVKAVGTSNRTFYEGRVAEKTTTQFSKTFERVGTSLALIDSKVKMTFTKTR